MSPTQRRPRPFTTAKWATTTDYLPMNQPAPSQKRLISLSGQDPELRKRGHFGSKFSANQYQWAWQQTLLHSDKNKAILDWGCGNGHFCIFLLEQGFQNVHGYAFRPPSLQELLPAGQTFTFHLGDRQEPTQLPFEDSSFSTILSIGVLEHVREFGGTEVASLREINRVLEPGGLFICAHLPNRNSLIEAIARARKAKYFHQYTYCEAEILGLLRQSGFARPSLMKRYGIIPRNSFSGRLAAIGNSKRCAQVLETADMLLSIMLRPFCQNYGFVCKKIIGDVQ